MATPAQRTNTWILNEWYDQAVAGTQGDYVGQKDIFVWGQNADGSLGLNQNPSNLEALSSPTQIGTDLDWNTISMSGGAVRALKSDGTIWGWGQGTDGQLGLNQGTGNVYISSPTQMPGTTWKNLGGGSTFLLATRTDGTLWSAGAKGYGKLGHGTGPGPGTSRSSPVQIGSGTNWSKAFTTSGSTAAALKTDGTLWTWGRNENSKLGSNDNVTRSSPMQVGTNTNWSKLNMGTDQALALNTLGELYTWGGNGKGELGLNAPENAHKSSPTQIPGTWSDMGTGHQMSAGIKTDGTLWCWGNNQYGNLGQNNWGNPYQRSSPVQVGTDTNWKTVRPLAQHMMFATKTDGTLWTWGANFSGSTGQNQSTGSTSPRLSSPTQIGTDTTWDLESYQGPGSQHPLFSHLF